MLRWEDERTATQAAIMKADMEKEGEDAKGEKRRVRRVVGRQVGEEILFLIGLDSLSSVLHLHQHLYSVFFHFISLSPLIQFNTQHLNFLSGARSTSVSGLGGHLCADKAITLNVTTRCNCVKAGQAGAVE